MAGILTNGPTIGIKVAEGGRLASRAADEPLGHRPVPDAGPRRLDGPAAEVAVRPRARLRLVHRLPGDGAGAQPAGLPVAARAIQPARFDLAPGDHGDHPVELPGRVAGLGDGPPASVVGGDVPFGRAGDGVGARSGRHLARDPGRGGDRRGAVQTLAYLAFSRIRVRPEPRGEADAKAFTQSGWSSLVGALAAVRGDPRFLRYLWGSLIFQLGNLLYDPIVRTFLSAELHFNYTQCVFIADVLPSTFSLATTPRLGAWLDRTNPLIAWSLIRLGWGIDPLLLALSPIWPAGAMAIAATARLIRGGVMNGSYILWWELGGNYFATRRELTSVYVGASFSVNGVQRHGRAAAGGPPRLGPFATRGARHRRPDGSARRLPRPPPDRGREDRRPLSHLRRHGARARRPHVPRTRPQPPARADLRDLTSPAAVRRDQPRRRFEREELEHPAPQPGSRLCPEGVHVQDPRSSASVGIGPDAHRGDQLHRRIPDGGIRVQLIRDCPILAVFRAGWRVENQAARGTRVPSSFVALLGLFASVSDALAA